MLIIRMSRAGAKHCPFYKIVVTDKRNSRDGKFIEKLGFFKPTGKDLLNKKNLYFNQERVDYWVSKGSQLSDRVVFLLKKYQYK